MPPIAVADAAAKPCGPPTPGPCPSTYRELVLRPPSADAIVLRQFANLAAPFGGKRVLAGIGAGWNREEFEAIGLDMPGFRARMDRLEESVALARQLFDQGSASLEGSQVVARELPLAPPVTVPPRLLLGGGSDRLLDIAGCYADALDLNGSSLRGAVSGADLPGADARRRLNTTVADLETSAGRVRAASVAAGRPRDAVSLSVLIGEPQRMADLLAERRERIGLDAVILAGSIDPRPFCEQVLPLLQRLSTSR